MKKMLVVVASALVSVFVVMSALAEARDGTCWKLGGDWNSAALWVNGLWPQERGVARVNVPGQAPGAHSLWALNVNVPNLVLGAFDFGKVGLAVTGASDCGIQYGGNNPYISHTYMRKPNNNSNVNYPDDYCYRTLCYNIPIRGMGDNKMTLKGRGEILIKQPMADFNEVEIRNVLMATNPAPDFAFTTCDTTLSGCLFYWPCGTADATATLAKGKTLTLEAGSVLTVRNTSQNRTATVELGTIARGFRGTLVIADQTGTLGNKERVKADGGVPMPYKGVIEPWIIGYNASHKLHFLTYDASVGFKPVEPTRVNDLANAGEDDIVLLNANARLSTNKKIRALVIENKASLTIDDGVTLTLGDDPDHAAALILNAETIDDYTFLSGMSGAIDFGRSPGFVWMTATSAFSYTRIDTQIRGTAGVTLAGGSAIVDSGYYPYVWRNQHFNFCRWTGGTTLVGVRLGVKVSAGAASAVNVFENCGDLCVVGADTAGGNALELDLGQGIIGNRVYVSGMGAQWNSNPAAPESTDDLAGAIIQTGSETAQRYTFTNRVTLVNDARFVARDNRNSGYEFKGSVDGRGDLQIWQKSAFTYFAATNTFHGRTLQVGTGTGAVGLTGCGTFGDGPVELESNLQFVDTDGLCVVTNDITCGSGAELVRANVGLFGKVDVAGSLANFGCSALVFGPDVTLGAIDATSTLTVTGATAQTALVLKGDGDSHLSPTFARNMPIVKGGAGTLTFHTADGGRGQSSAPALTVKSGTVAFENDLFKSRGLVYWLDASDPTTFETDPSTGNVMKWNSKNGNGYFFAAPNHPAEMRGDYPHDGYGAQTGVNKLNGMNVLTFAPGEERRNYLVGSRKVSQRTMFVVCVPRQTRQNQVLFGTTVNYSFRTASDNYKRWRVSEQSENYESSGGIYLNGEWTTDGTYAPKTAQILTIRHPVDVADPNWPSQTDVKYRGRDYERMQLGFQYTDVRTPDGYEGDVAEVLAFDTILTDDERKTVENYLAKKWGINNQLHADVATRSEQILDPTTTVTLNDAATLDLNGHSQTIASLSGCGKIVNSAGGAIPVLTITGTCDFRGVAEGVTLRLAGGAKLAAYGSGIPTAGLLYRVDASRPETMIENAQGIITNWMSRGGTGMALEWRSDRALSGATNGPTYQANSAVFGGRPGVHFAQKCQLRTVASSPTKTILFVASIDTPYVNMHCPWFSFAGASGMRTHITGDTGNNISLCYWTRFGNRVSVNGEPIVWGRNYAEKGTSYEQYRMPAGAFLYSARLGADRLVEAGKDDVLNDGGGNLGNGCWFGEVIAYDRCLTDDECATVESYLMNKWFGPTGKIPDESDDVQVKGDVELVVGTDGKIKPLVIEGTLDATGADLRVVNAKQGEKGAAQELVAASAVRSAFDSTSADYRWFDIQYLVDQMKYVGKRLVRGLILSVR